MKKIVTQKELTLEDAFQLLKENNWKVEDCLFSSTPSGTFEQNPPIKGTLVAVNGQFVEGSKGLAWRYCWHQQTKTQWEAGDTVKLINKRNTSFPLGSLGTIKNQDENFTKVEFFDPRSGSYHTQHIRAEDLEPFDPFEEWWDGSPEPLVWKTLGRDAFEAGREYERTLQTKTLHEKTCKT